MTDQFNSKIQEEVWQVIKDINNIRVNGSPKDLADFFHKDMVISHSDFKERGEGREECVQNYVDFTSRAKIHGFTESNAAVDVYGNTAIVTYTFEIAYEMNKQTLKDVGRDLFVLIQENDQWQAVWRIILPSPLANQN